MDFSFKAGILKLIEGDGKRILRADVRKGMVLVVCF